MTATNVPSASKTRRQIRRETAAEHAKLHPWSPTLPWRRSKPVDVGALRKVLRRGYEGLRNPESLRSMFHVGRASPARWKYPAGRKSRRAIERRGLSVSPGDEAAMDAHRAACAKGARA